MPFVYRDSTHSSPSPGSSGSNNSSQESLQKQQKRKGLKGSLGRMFKREKSRSLPRDGSSKDMAGLDHYAGQYVNVIGLDFIILDTA